LTGREIFSIAGLAAIEPRQTLTVAYTREDGSSGSFQALARIDGPTELNYLNNGGVLPTVLRRLNAS
jgi:aconitate hydratase